MRSDRLRIPFVQFIVLVSVLLTCSGCLLRLDAHILNHTDDDIVVTPLNGESGPCTIEPGGVCELRGVEMFSILSHAHTSTYEVARAPIVPLTRNPHPFFERKGGDVYRLIVERDGMLYLASPDDSWRVVTPQPSGYPLSPKASRANIP